MAKVIPNGEFPELLTLGENISYVRDILDNTVNNTTIKDDYVDVSKLGPDSSFHEFQNKVNKNVEDVPSHKVIVDFIFKKIMKIIDLKQKKIIFNSKNAKSSKKAFLLHS